MAFVTTKLFRNLHLTKSTVPNLIRTLSASTVPGISKPTPNSAILALNSSVYSPSIWHNKKIELPVLNKITPIGWVPNVIRWIPPVEEPKENLDMEMPGNVGEVKHAERMIVIRKKKMKKHKLKKLRKKMKFEWAKRRQRRELRKEKAFQAVLIKQCKSAEQFSAEQYVEERLAKLNEVITPFDWKEFVYVNPANRKK